MTGAGKPSDHRSAAAALRRKKTRARLIEAVVLVIAEKGVSTSLIDDVTRAADLSRGSFYNHFSSVAELLSAADLELANELVGRVIDEVAGISDPRLACATALHLYMATARTYPLLSHFAINLGVTSSRAGHLVHDIGTRLLEPAFASGHFVRMPPKLAFDLMAAAVSVALQHEARSDDSEVEAWVAALLRMFGVPACEAAEIARIKVMPLRLPPETLIARSESCQESRHGLGATAGPVSVSRGPPEGAWRGSLDAACR